MSHNDKDKGTPSTPRKPYAPPRVVSYGHVKDIIQGTGSTMMDVSPPNSKSCWIAEALYGVDDPRTLLLRAWLSVVYDERRAGWMGVALYRRFGRGTADLIRRGYLPRRLFRPLFDTLVEKALDQSAYAIVAARH